eukprot:TRINITY_DN59263_c0_g1_i1.p1 TRINITY_DN59263_c0_g1~~TRINITY_DN59263_c0_g1_i1.p1  ORF type:complete len:678 (-),score=119.90 TRINITY_DN59263_c0_g1_i1:170-2203(-)
MALKKMMAQGIGSQMRVYSPATSALQLSGDTDMERLIGTIVSKNLKVLLPQLLITMLDFFHEAAVDAELICDVNVAVVEGALDAYGLLCLRGGHAQDEHATSTHVAAGETAGAVTHQFQSHAPYSRNRSGRAKADEATLLDEEPDPHHLLGITVEAFRKVMERLGVPETAWSDTDGYTLLNLYVRPFLKREQAEQFSVCEVFQREGMDGVGFATHFLSHVQSETIADTFNGLRSYVQQHDLDPKTTVWWVDYFCLKQLTKDFAPKKVQALIKRLHHTVLLLSPWNKPSLVERVWCVFEIFCSIQSESDLHAHIPVAECDAFLKELIEDWDVAMKIAARVTVQNASAYRESDAKAIKNLIRLEQGFEFTNSAVSTAFRHSLLAMVDRALQGSQWEGLPKIRLQLSAAMLHDYLSKSEQAMALSVEALEGLKLLQEGEQYMATALYTHGICKFRAGDLTAAEELFNQSLQQAIDSNGATSREAGMAEYGLGLVANHFKVKRFDEALKRCERAEATLAKTLSADHQDMSRVLGLLGIVYMNLGQFEASERTLLRTLSSIEARCGSAHVDYANTVAKLASLYSRQNNAEAARTEFDRSLRLYTLVPGADDVRVGRTHHYFGEFLLKQRDFKAARLHFEEALRVNRVNASGDSKTFIKAAMGKIIEAIEGDLQEARNQMEEL